MLGNGWVWRACYACCFLDRVVLLRYWAGWQKRDGNLDLFSAVTCPAGPSGLPDLVNRAIDAFKSDIRCLTSGSQSKSFSLAAKKGIGNAHLLSALVQCGSASFSNSSSSTILSVTIDIKTLNAI